ncbi:hypothetical protein HB364_03020 [Pseudoflavitalea sp. X16]|uniref:hypothetical protein n=1 Tax=Paraflavitalea devenefica TaxID=2716334 RepID=UPI00141F0212|nr:hypothetical protein [Paraflavitalea devenefica]NII24037.1 hypothetical protein [Paraflavitalea devenefica]
MKIKALLLCLTVITSATCLQAQIQKGDLLLGATLGFNSNNNNGGNYSSSNTNLSPRVALAIGENSVLGLRTNFGYYTSKSELSDQKSRGTTVGASAFWRRYMPIKKQLGWYLEANGGVNFYRAVSYYSNTKSKTTTTQYGANVIPGIYYQALPRLLVNVDFGGLNYTHGRSKMDGAPVGKASSINFNLLSNFTFGVDFILGKK